MNVSSQLVRRGVLALVATITSVGGLVAFAGASGADISTDTVALAGTATPILGGVGGQAVSGWSITVNNTFSTGDIFDFVVNPTGATAATLDCADANYVAFSAVPTISVSGGPALPLGGTKPAVTAAIGTEAGTQSACSTVKNVLSLTFTNSFSKPLLGSATYTVSVSGVKYDVGAGATQGAVSMADSVYENNGGKLTAAPTLVPSNATVKEVGVSANNPPVGLAFGSVTNKAISPISFTEPASATVPAGYVCVSLVPATVAANSAVFDPSDAATVTATGGGAVVASAVSHPSPNTLAFNVTTASSTGPAIFTLGNLFVDGGAQLGPEGITVTTGSTSTCTGGNTIDTFGVRAFSVIFESRTSGADADTTAAAEMASVFPPTGATPTCPASKTVVLATDQNFPDALSASYLAGQLGSSILLTPTASLSNITQNIIGVEGITKVDVVGGPQAISQTVINQLKALPAYVCGGSAAVSPAQNVTVQVLAGDTEYDTSAAISQVLTSANVGKVAFPGAYGHYDDTGSTSSTSGPTTAATTAIVSTGTNYSDATAASVIAYDEHFPVILTTPTTLASQAQATLQALSIKQVILMGGSAAISNAEASQIEALGISVLRVAGLDFTDTATQLARFELSGASNAAGVTGLGWDLNGGNGNEITIARGDFYSDALAGAAFAALATGAGHPQPILLTVDPNDLGLSLTSLLAAGGSSVGIADDGFNSRIFVVNFLGGTVAITDNTAAEVLNEISGG